MDSDTPGLAITRSIGDMIEKGIEIISTPITSRYVLS